MSLAILVPVLRRPHRVKPLLESIWATTFEPTRVLFICDPDDEPERWEVRQHIVPRLQRAGNPLRWVDIMDTAGNYAAKINAGARRTNESVANLDTEPPDLFLGADDLHFHPGWLASARKRLTGTIGVVGTNDLCNRRVMAGQHSTHSLVARWYAELGTIDESDKLLHEGYEHEWVDDEFVATAKYRKAWDFAEDSVVEHLHPMVGKAPSDALYEQMPRRMRQGRRVFRRREPLWT